MNLLAAIPLLFAQYGIIELEQICAVTDTAEQIQECNYSRRINYGPYTLEQLPDLLELYAIHRTRGEYQEAVKVAHRLKWLVIKNESGFEVVIPNLTWLPDERLEHECFIKKGWQYDNWGECDPFRLMVVDSYILAYDLAVYSDLGKAAKSIARLLTHLTAGLKNLPLYVTESDGNFIHSRLNTDIPNQYRADLWLMRSR